ncbi:hypothetical protein LWI29_001074 [Acer saccharum]|uniref:Uncharacterized protein n=1 Tax=Acer saccharum TaxID=4024 RepID=A0AA39VHD3_ACESA|nr:hypothetical protein LWI29_001074 [Acer saccharum]
MEATGLQRLRDSTIVLIVRLLFGSDLVSSGQRPPRRTIVLTDLVSSGQRPQDSTIVLTVRLPDGSIESPGANRPETALVPITRPPNERHAIARNRTKIQWGAVLKVSPKTKPKRKQKNLTSQGPR